jgi:hypothetical protein
MAGNTKSSGLGPVLAAGGLIGGGVSAWRSRDDDDNKNRLRKILHGALYGSALGLGGSAVGGIGSALAGRSLAKRMKLDPMEAGLLSSVVGSVGGIAGGGYAGGHIATPDDGKKSAAYLVKLAIGSDPASLARLGRSALLSKLRLSRPGVTSRTPEDVLSASNAMGELAGRPGVYGTPASQGLMGAGSRGFDLSNWMESVKRPSANLHRIRKALKSLMGEGTPFVP